MLMCEFLLGSWPYSLLPIISSSDKASSRIRRICPGGCYGVPLRDSQALVYMRAARPSIIPADESRIAEWLDLRVALWPECSRPDSEQEIRALLQSPREDAFLAIGPDDRVIGFAEVSTRDYVDGCKTRPVGYLEGIFVLPEYRNRGVAKLLVQAAETWAAGQGCSEMGSDTRIDDTESMAFHNAIGFRETDRQVVFLKTIPGA